MFIIVPLTIPLALLIIFPHLYIVILVSLLVLGIVIAPFLILKEKYEEHMPYKAQEIIANAAKKTVKGTAKTISFTIQLIMFLFYGWIIFGVLLPEWLK